jgi:anti-sigma regulatory factor (Ser/Thr protein kinase)
MSRDRPPDLLVLDREYDGTTGTLRAARNDVVDFLREHVPDEDLHERAELVVSELATNAIQASPGVAYGLRVALAGDGSVVLVVRSSTRNGVPPPREVWGPAHPTAPRGRGLLIVDGLTDELAVERPSDDTIVITATFRVPTVHSPQR